MSTSPPAFGATIKDYTVIPGATSFSTAWDVWNGWLGTPSATCKIYNNPSTFPTTPTAKCQAAINHGARIYICYQPDRSLTATDSGNMVASINAMAAACVSAGKGATIAGVILYQEANDAGNYTPTLNATGTGGYVPVINFYGPAIRALTGAGFYGGTCRLIAGAGGGTPSGWLSFFQNAAQTCPFDGIEVDFYAGAYGNGITIDSGTNGGGTGNNITAIATALGIPMGIMEMGSKAGAPPGPSNATVISYIQYCQSVMTTWAASNPALDCAWYEGTGVNLISSASDYRIPYLQALITALAGSSPSGTFAEVQNGSNIAGSAGTLGLYFTQAGGTPSAAGTLLVARVAMNDGSQTVTAPSGWTLDTDQKSGTATSGIARTQIWHYPSNPGGLYGSATATANFTYSNTGSSIRGSLAEYSSPAGTTQLVDLANQGAAAAAAATTFPESEPAPARSGGLGVSAFACNYSATPSNSWTPPASWTSDVQLANIVNCWAGYFRLNLPAGAVSVTGQISTSTNMNGWAAALVTFYATTVTSQPSVTTTSLPAATVGTPYSQALAETGGTSPFSWAVTTGALPDGLALDPAAAVISGTPAASAATSGFTVTVTDANGLAASQSLFITVVAAAPPAPSPAAGAPGFPQVIIEAGIHAAAPQVPAGTFILDDPVYGKLDSGNKLGDATTWTDIAGYFRNGTISRPSTRVQGPLLTWQGGTATGTFDNATGTLDPDNPGGPYYGTLRPMMPFRARAVYGGTAYNMWSGFASSFAGADLTYDMGYDEVTIAADDGFKVLNGITIPAGASDSGAGDGETTGTRVIRILNAASWYTDHRRIDTGDTTVQGTLFGDTALNLLQLTADSEIGSLYIDGAGDVVFRHRQALLEDPRSAQVQAVFGDLPGYTVLTAANSDFESGTGTWVATGNCNIAATSAAAYTGAGSLQLTSIAAGDMSAAHCLASNILTQGLPVVPGQPVGCSAQVRAATTGRSVQAGAGFYDAAGTFISILNGPAVTDTTTGWVQASGVVTAPAGAAFCRLRVIVSATGAASEVHYVDAAQLYYAELACIPHRRAVDDAQLCNDVQVTTQGGTLQRAQDKVSQRTYLFPRAYARTDLILQDDATAKQWAQWVLAVSKAGDDHFDSVTIDPIADPANLFPQVLAREIGDRIQVWRRPQNTTTIGGYGDMYADLYPGDGTGTAVIAQDCFIRGITHNVDAVAGTWSTTWDLQSAAKYTGFLILDDPVNGKLNTGKLAF